MSHEQHSSLFTRNVLAAGVLTFGAILPNSALASPVETSPEIAAATTCVPSPEKNITSIVAPHAGFFLLRSTGQIESCGTAGSLPDANMPVGEKAASLAVRTAADGQLDEHSGWVFGDKGSVIAFGGAPYFGDMSKTSLNGPIVGSAATPSGEGYYMVGSDGGIFAFGDAKFFGSMGGKRLNKPVNGIVPTPTGLGYWLVASDGGVFAFGDAQFRGSMGGATLNKPVIGAVRYGNGYLMVGSDGGVFNFSDQPFNGSLGSNPPESPVTAIASRNNHGYVEVTRDGHVYVFGESSVSSGVGGSFYELNIPEDYNGLKVIKRNLNDGTERTYLYPFPKDLQVNSFVISPDETIAVATVFRGDGSSALISMDLRQGGGGTSPRLIRNWSNEGFLTLAGDTFDEHLSSVTALSASPTSLDTITFSVIDGSIIKKVNVPNTAAFDKFVPKAPLLMIDDGMPQLYGLKQSTGKSIPKYCTVTMYNPPHLSASGNIIVGQTSSNEFTICDVATDKLLVSKHTDMVISDVEISTDERVVITREAGGIVLFLASDGRQINEIKSPGVAAIAIK